MKAFKQREREYALERLRSLRSRHEEAREVLDFYEHILLFQKELYEALEGKEANWRKGMKWLYKLLDLCVQHGTQPIGERAQELKYTERELLGQAVDGFLKEKKAEPIDRLIFLSFLQPFYQRMAEEAEVNKEEWFKTRCPFCGFKPHLSYIADTEEVEGGRFLVCILCGTEWLYNRNRCVSCGNEEDQHINYFYEEENRAVQLQACDVCGKYIKLIDMRVNGLAVPQVDDIATLALDLWAQERGYTRFEPNIFGL